MTYVPIPYPRMLFKGQDHLIVNDEAGEAQARGEGWHDLNETPAPAPKRRAKKEV